MIRVDDFDPDWGYRGIKLNMEAGIAALANTKKIPDCRHWQFRGDVEVDYHG